MACNKTIKTSSVSRITAESLGVNHRFLPGLDVTPFRSKIAGEGPAVGRRALKKVGMEGLEASVFRGAGKNNEKITGASLDNACVRFVT